MEKYTNPSQFINKVDEETFLNILNKHEQLVEKFKNLYNENEEYGLDYATSLNDTGDFLIKNQRIDESKNYYLKALGVLENFLTNGLEKYINLLEHVKGKLCTIYHANKEFIQIVQLNKKYIDIYNKLDFPDDLLKISIINIMKVNIAKAYFSKGDYVEAYQYYQDSLKNIDDSTNQSVDIKCNILHDIAIIEFHNNQYDTAKKTFAEAINLCKNLKKTSSKYDGKLIDFQSEFSSKLDILKDNNMMITLLEDNIALMKTYKEMNSSQKQIYANHLLRLSKIKQSLKQYQQSLDLLNECLLIMEELSQIDPQKYSIIIPDIKNDIANSAICLGNLKLCEKMHNENIQFILSRSNQNDKQLAFLAQQYLKLSIVKDKNHETEDAFNYCKEAYKIYEKLIINNKKEYIYGYLDLKNSLSNFYYSFNDYYNSEKECLEIIEIMNDVDENNLKKEYLTTIYERLIKIYKNKNYDEVLVLNYKILMNLYDSLKNSKNGIYKIKNLNTCQEYAILLYKLKKYNESCEMLEKIIAGLDEVSVEEELKIKVKAESLRKLAYFSRMGKIAKNYDTLYKEAIECYRYLLKYDTVEYNILILDVQDEYANYLLDNKMYDDSKKLFINNLEEIIKLNNKNDNKYISTVAISQFKLARFYAIKKDFENAKKYYLQSLNTYNSLNEDQKYQKEIDQIVKILVSIEKTIQKK